MVDEPTLEQAEEFARWSVEHEAYPKVRALMAVLVNEYDRRQDRHNYATGRIGDALLNLNPDLPVARMLKSVHENLRADSREPDPSQGLDIAVQAVVEHWVNQMGRSYPSDETANRLGYLLDCLEDQFNKDSEEMNRGR